VSLGAVLLAMVGLVVLARQPKPIPHIIEVDHLGAAVYRGAVTQAAADYSPPESVIKYELRRFLEDTRTVSWDLLIDKRNWIDAFALVTAHAGYTLSAYVQAPENDPAKRAEDVRVAIELLSAVRISAESWQVDWRETTFDNSGQPQGSPSVWRAMFSPRHPAAEDRRRHGQKPARSLHRGILLGSRAGMKTHRTPLLAALALWISACASQQMAHRTAFVRAERTVDPPPPAPIVVEVPAAAASGAQLKPMPPASPKVARPAAAPPAQVVVEANRKASAAPDRGDTFNAIVQYAYEPGTLYQVYAAPMQVTDIVLEAGEKIIGQPASGDRRQQGFRASALSGHLELRARPRRRRPARRSSLGDP